MKKLILLLAGLLLLLWVAATNTQALSDKYDGECTGQETVGRCADKNLIDSSEIPSPTTQPVREEPAPPEVDGK